MRVAQVNIVRPRSPVPPEQLLADWPTLGDVAEAVQRAGTEVTVIQSFHCDAELVREGVRYRFVAEPGLPGRATGAMPGRLARAVRMAGADVVHVNGLDFSWHTRALCGLGLPVLAQDHASTPDAGCLRRRWGLAKVAGVAFTDAAQAEPFLRKGCLRPATRIFAVPESSTRFTPGDHEAARAATGLRGDPALLWIGRLDANKDPLTVLDAVARATRQIPGIRLWCCFHEQPLLAPVEARLAAPDLAGRVRLLGRVPHAQVEQLCRAADFFLLASHREGSGYALLEAMACGATPIVSDIPSFRALTGNGAVGALAPVGDAAGFAEALVRLTGAPRAELRRRTIAHFEQALSFEAVGARLRDIYATLIAGAA